MSKIFKLLAIMLGIITIFFFSILAYLFFSTRNPVTGSISLAGLTKKVTVLRDSHGVPHIKADNDADAFFALGYIHAQDRLWQMEFQRHIFKGTLSEMFGEATLEQDKFLRTLGFYRAAQDAWKALSPQAKNIIHHYTNGINAFLQTGQLPLQFKLLRYRPSPWLEVDSIAWQKMMAWDLQGTWLEKIEKYFIAKELGETEIATLLPPYPNNAPTILSLQNIKDAKLTSTINNPSKGLPADPLLQAVKKSTNLNAALNMSSVPGKGSNNWVVSGRLTESHKPLLANDPHLSLSSPNLWYLAEIETPNFHIVGATIPGLPAMIMGHNDHIAWGITNACVDAQDLYIEPHDASYQTLNETIQVKDHAAIHYTIRRSVHGPIISDVTEASKLNQAVALKWPALLPGDTTLQSFLELTYANNWQAFQLALSHYISPSQNFVYADKLGNIGYYLSGKIPVRKGWTGAFPVDSKESKEWQGFIPFNQLPHVYNPVEGYIVTANNQITPTNYPYQLTSRCEVTPHRAERIIELIKHKNHLTVADMASIQNDTKSLLWRDLKKELLKTRPLDNSSQLALDKLRKWDGSMDLKSDAATIFSLWFKQLSELMPDKLKPFSQWTSPLFIKQQLLTNGKYCQLAAAKNCADFLSLSLQRAVVEIHHLGGKDKSWRWGDIHHAKFEELGLGAVPYLGWIWNRQISTAGDAFTVNVGTYDFKNFSQIAGAGYRQIIDLSDTKRSEFVQALGQSNDVFSSHYDDLMPLWQSGRYLTMNDASQTKRLTLMPAK